MGKLHLVVAMICATPYVIQAKSVNTGLWQPETGTREEWLKCHGFPCDEWKETRQKLQDLKIASVGPGFHDMELKRLLMNDTDDSLDGCIWLTGEQLDYILEEMKNDFDGSDSQESQTSKSQHHGRRTKRKVADFQHINMWPTTIHWKFDGDHTESEKQFIRGAFHHWMAQTCLTFNELDTNEQFSDHHILVTKNNTGCRSFIGRIKTKPQQLNLEAACLGSLGTSVHEIGHAIGFWHEQQRSDRDETIRVNRKNLGYYAGLLKIENTNNMFAQYDLGSVMHYAPKDGSKNGQIVIESLNPLYQRVMGQRTGLSYWDTKSANLAYCSGECTNTLSMPCLHGGYQDPKSCYQCRCPDGLSGTYCDRVAPSKNAHCGGEIVPTSTPQYIESPGFSYVGHYENHQECNWHVKAPKGKKISLSFEDKFGLYCHNQEQCHHWVEIKYKQDIGARGPRFCCYETPTEIIESELNEMLVVFRSNWTTGCERNRIGFRAKIVLPDASGLPPTSTSNCTTTTTMPSTTTTATTTTVSSTTTTQSSPNKTDCDVLDLMLVVDSSGGVMANNWTQVVRFMKNIVRKFKVSQDHVHVGLITYGSRPNLTIHLGQEKNINDLMSAIDRAEFHAGATETDLALKLMQEEFQARGRYGVRQLAILITDGDTKHPSLAIKAAMAANKTGIDLYAVGITMKVDAKVVTNMTGDHRKFIQIDTFNDIVSEYINYAMAIYNLACKTSTNCVSNGGDTDGDSKVFWRCSFESSDDPLCGMKQEHYLDDFDWTRNKGPTDSGDTGPVMAKDGNYYIYIEATKPKESHKAIISMPPFKELGIRCLKFSYNMFGHHTRTLQVLKKSVTGDMIPIWQRFGEQGMSWIDGELERCFDIGDTLAFVGVRGKAFSGDIAIDNIRLSGGAC